MDACIEIFEFRLACAPSPNQQELIWRRALRSDPCSYCGAVATHSDHIHAQWTGGENAWPNLTAACRSCNLSRGSRSLLSFLSGHAVGEDQWTKNKRRLEAYYARMAA